MNLSWPSAGPMLSPSPAASRAPNRMDRRRMASSPLVVPSGEQLAGDERPGLGVPGRAKKRAASACSISRPLCRKTISSAWRRAWPRSWVVMTILTPRSCIAAITASIARVAAGSRFAVGSSRNRTLGSSAQARASARRCCSPPESTRAGRSAMWASPTCSSAAFTRRRRSARHARDGERIGDVGRGRAAQQHRALEDESLLPAQSGRIVAGPADAAGGRPDQAVAEPQQQALAGAVRARERPCACRDQSGSDRRSGAGRQPRS